LIELILPWPPSAKQFKWTPDLVSWLTENYPAHGKDWCANALGVNEGVIRSKASSLQLKARGVSTAWKSKQKQHAEILRGRKRPEQADVMKHAIHDRGLGRQSDEFYRQLGEKNAARIKAVGHPKGFLGHKHSAESRALIAEKSNAWVATMTPDKWHDLTRKSTMTREKNGTLYPVRPNTSWKAGWKEIGGKRKYFRSLWESNYARYLEWLKQKGQIAEWEHEPETFWFNGIKRGCVSYLPDFRVTELSGARVYHEVKGWMDARSITKIRRMAKYHPSVKLIVIDAKAYKALQKDVKGLVPSWE